MVNKPGTPPLFRARAVVSKDWEITMENARKFVYTFIAYCASHYKLMKKNTNMNA
jgi:hypothetical protein